MVSFSVAVCTKPSTTFVPVAVTSRARTTASLPKVLPSSFHAVCRRAGESAHGDFRARRTVRGGRCRMPEG